MRRGLGLGALTASLLLPVGQAATVAPTLPLDTQARRAELIVRGSLGAPQTVTEGHVSWRVYPLTLSETVVGDAGRLTSLAGEPALYVWAEADDLPSWRTGQDAFFLLYATRMDSPLVGYNQGYYPVIDGSVTLPAGETASRPTTFTSAVPVQSPVASGGAIAATAPATVSVPPANEKQLPAPADPAPDAPPVSALDRDPTVLPGLPSAATEAGTQTAPAAAPAPAPASTPAAASRQVTADEFRALLLRARGVRQGVGK